ncbi:MAG: LysR family transcriptional regulator [Oscillospiraceae bacterium]|nr:LysR family transcriptional regulator [Oscillospiraceae bacterium]
MEIRNLRTFQQVAERNSFTAAATALGYSQSTVSFQIKQLETELGVLLFERINHNLVLTEEGRSVLDYAQSVLRLTDEFRQSMDHTHVLTGTVHIVTPDSLCKDIITDSYDEFYRQFPYINLKFSSGDTMDMFRMLDRNEADVILTLDGRVYSKEYIIAKEERVDLHFVTGINSPYAKPGPVTIQDLLTAPFILTEKSMGYRKVLDRTLAKKSMELNPVLELGRTDLITSVLTHGTGISFLPDFVTAEGIARGELIYLDVVDVEVEVWKQLIYHRNKWLSRSLKAFLEYIIKTEFHCL